MKMLVTQLMLQVKNNKRSFWLKINCSNIYDIYTEIQIFINSKYVFKIDNYILKL